MSITMKSTFAARMQRLPLASQVAALRHDRPSFGTALLVAGVTVGLLDATDGVIYYGITGPWSPIKVLQYIASGALGSAAFDGGLAAAALGLVIHFALSFSFAGIYLLAATRLPILRSRAVIAGLLYGAAVYLGMNFVVLPHSGTPRMANTAPSLLNGILGHAFLVGLPIALAARTFLGRPAAAQVA